MTDYYYNPAGGNWSSAAWGTAAAGPYNAGPPGAGDNAWLNGATVVCDVTSITCTQISNNTVAGGTLTCDCTVRSYTFTCNLLAGPTVLVKTTGQPGTVRVTGNLVGGSGNRAHALQVGTANAAVGAVTIVGNSTGGSGVACLGVMMYGYNNVTMTGNLTGGLGAYCYGFGGTYGSGYTLNLTGNVYGGTGGTSNYGFDGNTNSWHLIISGSIYNGNGYDGCGVANHNTLTLTNGNVISSGTGGWPVYLGNSTTITGNVTAQYGVAVYSGGNTTVTGNVTGGYMDLCHGIYGSGPVTVTGTVSGGPMGTGNHGLMACTTMTVNSGNLIDTPYGQAYWNSTNTTAYRARNMTWNPGASNYVQIRTSGGVIQASLLGVTSYPATSQVKSGVTYHGGDMTGTYEGVFSIAEQNQIRYALGITGTTAATTGTGVIDEIYSKQPANQPSVNSSNAVLAQSVKVASSGLDAVATTAPSGVASNFREMLVQIWRLFFKKVTKSSTEIKTYADDGGTVLTTQTISTSGYDETQGASS